MSHDENRFMENVSSDSDVQGGIRRAYAEEDAFFDEGNILRYSKFVVESSSSSSSSTKSMGTLIEMVAKPLLPYGTNCIECNFPGCYERFPSIPSFNAHYHIHTCHCLTCNAICPNQRLLDIHISENHSSYFEAQACRKPSYVCIVESCPQIFWTSNERNEHLHIVHKFSANYSFISWTCTKTQLKKAEKKQRNKKDPSKIMCKFVKSGQTCKKGIKCKFKHLDTVSHKMEYVDEDRKEEEMEGENDIDQQKKTIQVKLQSDDIDISSSEESSLENSVNALMNRFDQISFGQKNASANGKGGIQRRQRLQL